MKESVMPSRLVISNENIKYGKLYSAKVENL